VRFNTTIEDLQTETDYFVTGADAQPLGGGPNYRATLTIPDHDLEVGNRFRISNASNDNFNRDFTVLAVNGDQVVVDFQGDPGAFVGSGSVTKLTITNPLDLRDEGLEAGISPPEDIFVWRSQLDQAVRNQISAGDNIWGQLFGNVVLGGGATLSIDPIPDTVLQFKMDLLIDSNLRILLTGNLSLVDGFVEVPAKLYADLSELFHGTGRFLFLADMPDFQVDLDPLLVFRGRVAFEPLVGQSIMDASVTKNSSGAFWEIKVTLPNDNPSDEYRVGDKAVIFGSHPPSGSFGFDGNYEVMAVDDTTNTITVKSTKDPGTWASGSVGTVVNENALEGGFRITMDGGVDVNIPGFDSGGNPFTVTTITLEGGAELEFRRPGPGVAEDLLVNLSFNATLSETHVGTIAEADGAFHVSIDADVPLGSRNTIQVWGAAILTTNFDFLKKVGLFATASGLLRINSSDSDKPSEELKDSNNNTVIVALPAKSFALRLDGSVDFRIDFNGNHSFATSESVFEIAGSFVLEFASDGFNVAIFREIGGSIQPATFRLGPRGSPFLEFNVFAFLAIRDNGIAANLVLTRSLGASGPLSNIISLDARFVFVVNTTGQQVTFSIPGGASDPNRPAGISTLIIPKAGPANPAALADASLNSIINGTPWSAEATPGPYGVLFLKGDLTLLSVVTLQASGFVSLNPDGLSMQVKMAGNFLSLVSISGTAAFNSDGEFFASVSGGITLGSDSTNISGSASLTLSYWDSNQMLFHGSGGKSLSISGTLGVSAKIFGISLGSFTLGVGYSNGAVTVSVPYPEPFWDSSCWSTLFGDVCVYYPNFRTAYYSFTIGHINGVGAPPPPPIILGQVDGNGILTLNVGPNAGARNLQGSEVNESVIIDGASGSQRGQKITITMFGVSREFDNVTDIQVGDMADGSDVVEISNTVTTRVTVHLGSGSDTLNNRGSAAVIAFGDGDNDRLTGGGGNDQLFCGTGDDFMDGQAGQDSMEGGDGSDTMFGGAGNDTLKGGAGWDRIVGDLGSIAGDGLSATLQTQISATAGNDTIDGGEQADVIFGGGGQDSILGGGDRDILVGDDGTATFSSTLGVTFTVADLEFGASDVIDGGAENDKIFGMRGDDSLTGGTGDDEIYGGTGNDVTHWTVGDGNDRVDGQGGSDTVSIIGTDNGSEHLTITAKDSGFTTTIGAETLTVDGVEIANIEARQGADQLTFNDLASSVLRQINLKLGSDTVQDSVVVNGSTRDDVFTIAPTGNIIRVQERGGATVDISDANETSGNDSITLNTLEGVDSVNVLGTKAGTITTLNTGAGNDTITIGSLAPESGGTLNDIAALVTVNGEGDSDTLNLDDAADSASNLGTLTGTTVTGLDMLGGITYGGLEALNVFLGSGSDNFTIESTHAGSTRVDANDGNDTVNVLSTAGESTINAGSGEDTVNIGSLAPSPGGIVNGIKARLTVNGDSDADILNVDNSGDLYTASGTLTGATITGLSMGGSIAYTTLESLNIALGSGPDAFTIESTHGGRTRVDANAGNDIINIQSTAGETTINSEAGEDVINVGSFAPGGNGTVNQISGLLIVNGDGDSDTLNVDDSGDTDSNTGTLNGTMISGLGMGEGVHYATFEALNIALGSGSDGFIIANTHAGTTKLDSGAGDDTVTVLNTGGQAVVNTGTDRDTVNLRGVGAAITVNAGDGNDIINLSSDAPANIGTLDGLVAVVTIEAGAGGNTLNVSDQGSVIADQNVIITGNAITGLGPEKIYYGATGGTFGGGINIEAGSGGNHIEIRSTNSSEGTTTTVGSGNGNDVVLVTESKPSSLVINGEAGDDVIDASAAMTGIVINGGADDDIITGGAGNDRLSGDDGDDRIIAGLGSDNVNGGEGRDVLLGDTGIILRTGKEDGSWSSSVLLTDVGAITVWYNLNNFQWTDLNAALALDILKADIVLLTGAYNSDGTRHLIRNANGCLQWETRLLLISLLPDGNDVMDGGGGDDALFGGRGNDSLTGGSGGDYVEGGAGDDTLNGGADDDTLIGDNSTVAGKDGPVGNVAHGLKLVTAGTDSSTLIPLVSIVPGHEINALNSVFSQISQDFSWMAGRNALVESDGTAYVPFASIVTDIAHHRALLSGNDTLYGGDGNDELTGDDSTRFARSITFTAELTNRAAGLLGDLRQLSGNWADFGCDLLAGQGRPDFDACDVVIDATIAIGRDTLDGGAGSDMIVGDDRAVSLPSLTVPLCLLDEVRCFTDNSNSVEDNLWDAARDLSEVEHRLRDIVTSVRHGKHFDIHIEQHIDRLQIGNDLLNGGDGNDMLAGDDWNQIAPSIIVTTENVVVWAKKDEHGWEDRDSHSQGNGNHHDSPSDSLIAGEDTMNGGAGNDLMFGDSAIFLTSTVTVSGNCDSPNALHQGQELANDLLGMSNGNSSHEDENQFGDGGNDLLNGDDGDDILFGQPGCDTLRGGAGNDWLIGGANKDSLEDSLGQNQKYQGENESKALREGLADRLSEFGIFNGCPLTIKFKLPKIFTTKS
jgi:Ca2+-binding RTX toxin-like protein